MVKNNIRIFTILNKLHEQEAKFKKELAKTYLEYLDALPTNKRIEQIESILYETCNRNLPTHDRRLTPQERKCLVLASKGKEIKEMASILGLSQRTIKYHRANITKKLEVPNLMAAVALKNQNIAIDDNDANLQNLSFPLLHKLLIDCLPVNIFIVNKNGYMVWANQRMLKTLNESMESFIGKHISFWGDNQWTFCQTVMQTKFEQGIEEIGIDSENRKAIYLSIRTPIKDECGDVDGLIGISIDITARKQSEIAKQDSLMQMAHDLKNPLNLLSAEPPKKNKSNQQVILQSIHDTSEKLLELINLMIK